MPAAVPLCLALLVYGWFGTWAYGFLWVPGAAALVACCFRRPARSNRMPEPSPPVA
ncbi:MAG: hypothetical protein AABY18_04185 [Candidatus Thermoplasmatota archaeon]